MRTLAPITIITVYGSVTVVRNENHSEVIEDIVFEGNEKLIRQEVDKAIQWIENNTNEKWKPFSGVRIKA